MKPILLIQFICAILLTIATIGMMIGALVKDSMNLWKAFTIIIVIFSISFIKQSYKELRDEA